MKYTLRRKIFVLFGKVFTILNDKGSVVGYAKQKAFKLREELHIFGDKEMKKPLVEMKARNILDFGATFDVTDSRTGAFVGALRRLGFRSMFRDEWRILSAGDVQIGMIQEDSKLLAFVRRFMSNLVPQQFTITVGDDSVGTFRQKFNLFRYQLELDFDEKLLDERLAFAAAVLIGSIEGRQE